MQLICNKSSTVLVQMPAYTYKKGMLYLSEVNALKALGDTGMYFDKKFSIQLQAKTHAKDGRP